MLAESRHISAWIDRPAKQVYEYASDPAKLSTWAAGLGGPVEKMDGHWVARSPAGPVAVEFLPRNELGVLDHTVSLPSGEVVYLPMRVISYGDHSEVVFTLRRRPEMSDGDFARDIDAVSADLSMLKRMVEEPTPPRAPQVGPRSAST